jgi:ABC-2 type transport system ATP-binding protein
MCTHNLDEADRLCDRIAVFKSQLRVVDTPGGLRRQLYGRQVVIHLASEGRPFLKTVEAFPFVKRAEAIDNKLVLSLEEPETHNPEIIRSLVTNGADIQFVGELRHSLEDIYLQLVKG